MKSSVKITATVLSLLLAVISLSACSLKNDNGDNTTTTASDTTEVPSEITSESTTEATETTEAPTTTQTKVEKESIDTVLSLIRNFPVGTAGSTVKCVDIALRLMNFAQSCDDTDSVKTDCKHYFSELSSREKMMFEDNLLEIDAAARKLIEGGSSLDRYAEESDEKFDKGNYSLDKYETIYNIIKNV